MTTIQIIRLTPYGASLIVLDFPVTFPRVACHLCCQVALGEAEGAAQGVPTVHIKKMADLQLNKCYKGILFRPLGCFVGYLL